MPAMGPGHHGAGFYRPFLNPSILPVGGLFLPKRLDGHAASWPWTRCSASLPMHPCGVICQR